MPASKDGQRTDYGKVVTHFYKQHNKKPPIGGSLFCFHECTPTILNGCHLDRPPSSAHTTAVPPAAGEKSFNSWAVPVCGNLSSPGQAASA